ncbi:MAG: 50S ribosomal protein L28 [Patescibacteria group bacterium]|jgi:large subunit ribosomal protein L28
MSNTCQITGKKPLTGNNVSHSNVKTKRRQYPNAMKRRLLNPATGKMIQMYVTARGLRTLAKWKAAGKKYDLRTMTK